MQKRIRESSLIAGLEQTGKTYYAETMADLYVKNGKTAVIYNSGKDSDFSGAEVCEPLSKNQLLAIARTKEQKNAVKYINYCPVFKDQKTDQVLPFILFRSFYKGKKVKIYRYEDDSKIFKTFFKFVFDSLLIIDDMRPITRHGISHELNELISRKNHAGFSVSKNNCGNDMFFIYHNLDTAPTELFDLITRIVLFRLRRVPDLKKEDPETVAAINEAFNELKTLPKYSRIELAVRGYDEVKKSTYIFNR